MPDNEFLALLASWWYDFIDRSRPNDDLCNSQPSSSPSSATKQSHHPVRSRQPGQILVCFRSTLARGQAAQIIAAEGLQPVRRIPGLDVDLLQLPAGRSVHEAVERCLRYRDVAFAEPNYLLSLAQVDDPGLAIQWAPQILEAPAAWAITAGDPAVLIAVTDTGVDYGHSELAPTRSGWLRPRAKMSALASLSMARTWLPWRRRARTSVRLQGCAIR
jgi:hypothetical protein